MWGDLSATAIIIVNGIANPVTKNLDSALKHLRLKSRPRVFWADAVCINQSDNAEKSVQVGRMGQIYGNASRVLAWLGEATEDTRLAFHTLRNLASFYPNLLKRGIEAEAKPGDLRLLRLNTRSHWDTLPDFVSNFLPSVSRRRLWRFTNGKLNLAKILGIDASPALDSLNHRLWWARLWIT